MSLSGHARAACALGVALLLGAVPGETQSCYTSPGRFYDDCNDSSAFYPPQEARFLQVGNKQVMLIDTNFQVRLFDMTNPSLPAAGPIIVMPFPPGCGLPFGCGNPHFQYEDTVESLSVASLGTIGYAFAPLSGYGWDLLKVTVSGNAIVADWFNTGYHPPGNGGPYNSGALFVHDGQLYLVGQMLDQASVAAYDKSIRIYHLGTTPPANLYEQIGTGVRVPIGGANDPQPYNAANLSMGYIRLWVREVGARRILFARSTLPGSQNQNMWFAAFDITDPSTPLPALFVPYAADPNLFSGALAFEEGADRLWLAKPQGGDPANVTIRAYALTAGAGSVSLTEVSWGMWDLGAQQGAGAPQVAAGYGLLVFGWMQVGKAFAISSSGTLSPLPDQPGYTDLSVNLEAPCQYWDLARGYMGLAVYPGANGNVLFYRSAMKEGRMIEVAASCLTLAPTAQLSVANSSPAEAAGANCGAADADGFPGDTFQFSDSSVGNITYKTLTVCANAAGCPSPVFSATWSQAGGWNPGLSWTSSATDLGVFVATLTVGNGSDPDSTASKTIRLCSNPQAVLTRTPDAASYLQGSPLTLGAGSSTGHPTGYSFYLWEPQNPTPTVTNVASGSVSTSLSTCGTYQAAVVAHYAHAGADSGCGAWYSDGNPNYDSCSPVQSFAVGAVQGSVRVQQNSQDTDFPVAGQPTTVSFQGQVAGGYTVSYSWSATAGNQPVNVAGLSDCTQASCTIPANTLTPGVAYTFTVQLLLSPDPGSCAVAPLSKTVTPTAATATMQIQNTAGQPISQAAVGQTVRLKVTSYSGLALNQLKFKLVGNESCAGETELQVSCVGQICVDYRELSFKNPGTATVQLVWVTQGGEQVMDSKTVDITPGSCPSNCTYSLSPASASFGAGGGNGSFTVSTSSGCAWQAVADASWIQITSGGSGVGPGTVSYAVAANAGSSRSGKIRVPDAASSVSHTVLQSGSGGGGGGTLTITPTPSQVSSFPVTVTFAFNPPLTQNGDTLTFNFGDGQQQTVTRALGVDISSVNHTYSGPPASGNAFSVTASGTIGGQSYSGSTQVTVACNAPTAPTAEFTWTPAQPRAGQPIQFQDQSTGQPTSWQWDFGLPLGGDTSSQQNPSFTYQAAGTFTVTLTVSNCKGSSQKQKQITILGACGETAPPEADFTWEPASPTSAQVCQVFPSQCAKQPYAGQVVRLVDASTRNPSNWHWYDFQELGQDFQGQATVTVTWTQPGGKNVRLKAQNCVGWSQEKLKTVHIYPDERPVTANFSWSGNLRVGESVTLTAATGFEKGDPNQFAWEIDDPFPGEANPVRLSGSPVSYAFRCGGERKVTLTASRGSFQGRVTKMVPIEGPTCGPQALVAADAAKVPGLNNTLWRTDLRLFNPWDESVLVSIDVLPPGQSNANPPGVSNLPLGPKATLVLDNFLEFFRQQTGQDLAKAALRVHFQPADKPPVVVGRTYTDAPGGGTYGQFIPALEVRPGSSPAEQWLTGLRQDGTGSQGFRTNVSLYNLRDDRDARAVLELYDASGQLKGQKTKSIAPLGYEQAPILQLFNASDPLSLASLRIRLQEGDLGVNASVVDNRTGDGSLASNEPPVSGQVLVIPGIARLAGEAGTVWRSSLALTNPYDQPKTWSLTLVRKLDEGGTRNVGGSLTVGPKGSWQEETDLIGWFYNGDPVPEKVRGILKIEPDDQGQFPQVVARTFNLAPDGGTFGQTLKGFHAGNSAGGGTPYRKLLLTGMASEDIARSNLGFVHVGGGTVNFKVWFYDEAGHLLNPEGQPYTVALSATNPWEQDKLENRFRNKGWTLPSNLRAISAVIEVEGGMGQAYASVIDNLTGDPVFIAAVPAP